MRQGIAAPHSEAKGFEAPDAEVGGPNRATYWVTSSPTGMWTQLPKVTPNQITAARKIKRYFSGSLSSKISGHPPFPGKEIHLLRAQIARIDASTGIAPAGHFTASDDDAFVVKAVADAEVPSNEAAALADVGAWVHRSSEITTSGRCKKEVKLDEEGNPVEDADAPEEIPPLREVSSDKEGAWVAKTCGGGGAHSLAVLKSQLWPGAVAVGYGKRFTNVYVGYGVKTESKSYTPQAPPAIGGEFEDPDLVEQKDVLQDPDAGKEEGNAEE
jgi:radial spoke head protein 4A